MRTPSNYPQTLAQWLLAVICVVLLAAMFVVGFLNEAMGCNRANTEHCLIVHHAWAIGL